MEKSGNFEVDKWQPCLLSVSSFPACLHNVSVCLGRFREIIKPVPFS